ncbi:MAG: membrane protein insertase YidC [Bdellovibrionota bacterium]|nr:MAG: membrane protein insertase YidC [Bdellovibrionota bacterium]
MQQASAPAAPANIASAPSADEISRAPVTVIETTKFRVQLVHLGARARSLQLLRHKAKATAEDPYQLVHSTSSSPLPLGVYFGDQSDASILYQVDGISRPVDPKDGIVRLAEHDDVSISMSGVAADGSRIRKIFHFFGNNYLFNLEVAVERPVLDGTKVWLEWSYHLPQEIVQQSYNQSSIKFLEDSSVTTELLSAISPETKEAITGRWIGVGDYYFIATVIAPQSGQLRYENRNYDFLVRAAGSESGGSFSVYAGPKQHVEMEPARLSLEKSIDLGWFTFLAYPLLVVLRFFLQSALQLRLGNCPAHHLHKGHILAPDPGKFEFHEGHAGSPAGD